MKLARFFPLVFWILTVFISYSALAEDKYVEIIGNKVNIRSGSSTKSSIVAKALKGDIFKYYGEKGDWYKISMFSGESRYVHKSLSKFTEYETELPNEVSKRRTIFREILRAEDRAQAEADRKYPMSDKYGRSIPGNIEKNIDYSRILNDKYKLEVIHKFNIQPPTYSKLVIEGVKNNW